MQKLTPEVIRQLNNLGGGFPPAPNGPNNEPRNDEQWILGDWIFECRVRPGVSALSDLPLVDNTLGDVRFVIGLGAWYWWDGAVWRSTYTFGSQNVVWYGVGRLSSATDLAGWQASPVKNSGSVDVVDCLEQYLACWWRFSAENGSGSQVVDEHPPFPNLAAFEAYIALLRSQGFQPDPDGALFAQPFDLIDEGVPKLNDFYANNMLWTMLFNRQPHALWSPNGNGNAAKDQASFGSKLNDSTKQAILGGAWANSFSSAFPWSGNPLEYQCFWRATAKRNLWTWTHQFKGGGNPIPVNLRTALDITTNSVVTFANPYIEPFEVDLSARTSVSTVRDDLAVTNTFRLNRYTSLQKSGCEAYEVSRSSVLGIPLQSVNNPNLKAMYFKPVSQDSWYFRMAGGLGVFGGDDGAYSIDAVVYGGANRFNGAPVVRRLPPGATGGYSAAQNVSTKLTLDILQNLPVNHRALNLRPGNKIRFRLRNTVTGRVGPFGDAALVVTPDEAFPPLMRLLLKSPE